MLSAGLVLMRMPRDGAKLVGAALVLAGIAWYLWVETGWFRRQLDVGAGQASLVAVGIFLKASFYWAVLGAGLAALMG
jgi:hypothetical protein